jgi:hypothetical protein
VDVFGATGHGFELKPTISEPEVCVFEQHHRIRLPEDYRQFITQIGNGGAGPYYGVFPLGQMDDGFELSEWPEGEGLVGVLSRDFPLREEWNDLSGMPSEDLLHVNQDEYDRQVESFDAKYWTSSLTSGAIPICDQGCSLRIWLVVTGDEPGKLWDDRRAEYKGLWPLLLRSGERATFSRWYQEWLDECMRQVR